MILGVCSSNLMNTGECGDWGYVKFEQKIMNANTISYIADPLSKKDERISEQFVWCSVRCFGGRRIQYLVCLQLLGMDLMHQELLKCTDCFNHHHCPPTFWNEVSLMRHHLIKNPKNLFNLIFKLVNSSMNYNACMIWIIMWLKWFWNQSWMIRIIMWLKWFWNNSWMIRIIM